MLKPLIPTVRNGGRGLPELHTETPVFFKAVGEGGRSPNSHPQRELNYSTMVAKEGRLA